MSGGTLISLAAAEIVMSEHAVIGPVDPQVGRYPAASVLKAVARKPVERIDDETLVLADQAEKALSLLRDALRELLADKTPPEKAEELARLLSQGTWTHDHPITFETARGFGLPVRSDIPPAFMDLMALYPQPVRRQPGVEYLPQRRHLPGDSVPRTENAGGPRSVEREVTSRSAKPCRRRRFASGPDRAASP
jgi:ClpP class serine protease